MKSSIKLNQLVASMEAMEEQELNVNPEDSFNEMQEAQIALEGYCEAYKVLHKFEDKEILSMEVYNSVMTLVEHNKILPTNLKISLEDNSNDKNFLQRVKDKILATIKYLIEMISSIYKKVGNFLSSSFRNFNKTAEEVKEKLKHSDGSYSETKIPANLIYLIVDSNGNIYTTEEIENACNTLFISIPEILEESIKELNVNINDSIKISINSNTKLIDNIQSNAISISGRMSKKLNPLLSSSRKLDNKDKDSVFNIYQAITGSNVYMSYGLSTTENFETIIKTNILFSKDALAEHDFYIYDGEIDLKNLDSSKVENLCKIIIEKNEGYLSKYKGFGESIKKEIEDIENTLVKALTKSDSVEDFLTITAKISNDFKHLTKSMRDVGMAGGKIVQQVNTILESIKFE